MIGSNAHPRALLAMAEGTAVPRPATPAVRASSAAMRPVLIPISGRDVTCGVSDYVRTLAASIEAVRPGLVEVAHVEPGRPLAFMRLILARLRAGGTVHLNLPVEGWGTSLLPGASLFLARLLTRRGRAVLTLHEWLSLHPLRHLSLLPNLWVADVAILVSRQQWRGFRVARSVRRGLAARARMIPIGPNIMHAGEAPTPAPRPADGRLRIGYFGVLYASKQPGLMLESLAALARRGRDACLVVCGDFLADKPEERDAFLAQARALGVEDRLEMRGRIEDPRDVLDLLASCDLHLLLYSDGVSTRRSSFLACLQLPQPIVTTQPVEPDEFEGWPAVEGAIEAGEIICLPADATPEAVAEAIEKAADEAGLRKPADLAELWSKAAVGHLALYGERA